MKTTDYEIVIIGAGCIGSSIAFELSRRGYQNVAILDRGLNSLSATSQSGGMLRVFHESTAHIDLALNTLSKIKQYQDHGILSEKNIANGNLYFFDKRRYTDYQTNLQKMENKNYPFEIITPPNGRKRFPQFHWVDNQWAIYEPLATHLSPLQFSKDLLIASQKLGLTYHSDFHVERICYFNKQHRIFDGQSMITAKILILAGGAGLLPHLKELGIGHSLKAQTITAYRAQKINETILFPNYFDRENLEFGRFGSGSEIIISQPQTQRLIKKYWNEDTLSEFSAPDSYSPGRKGFAGFLMGQPGMMLATGWGGTAFKFSLTIGQQIADSLSSELNERSVLHV